MSVAQALCGSCGAVVRQSQGAINRAIREGKPLYCDRTCAGMARRISTSQKKRRKRDYDARFRAENAAEISARKAEYFQRSYDPDKAREHRRAHMDRHVEHCRKPEYKAYKQDYDLHRQASQYGEHADAYLLLRELEREIRSRVPDKYERAKARGYYTRNAQQRRRELWQATTRI